MTEKDELDDVVEDETVVDPPPDPPKPPDTPDPPKKAKPPKKKKDDTSAEPDDDESDDIIESIFQGFDEKLESLGGAMGRMVERGEKRDKRTNRRATFKKIRRTTKRKRTAAEPDSKRKKSGVPFLR